MPRIQQYEAGSGQLSIPEGGAAAFALVGRRAEAITGELGQEFGRIASEGQVAVQRHDTMQQVGTLSSAASGELLATQQDINKTIGQSDPNDPTLPDKLHKVVDDHLQSLQDNVSKMDLTPQAQEHFLGLKDRMQSQLYEHITGAAAQAAGVGVMQSAQQTEANLTNAVGNDPTYFQTAVDTYASTIKALAASHPNASGEVLQKMQTEGVQAFGQKAARAAVLGALNRSPEAAEAVARDPAISKYLDGAQVQLAIKQAKREDIAEARTATVFEREQRTEGANNAFFDFLKSVTPGPTGYTVAPGALQNLRQTLEKVGGGVGVPHYQAALNLVEGADKGAVKPDPADFSAFKDRALLPPSDPNYLPEAKAIELVGKPGGISPADYNWMKAEIYEPRKAGGQANLETDTINDIRKAARAKLVPTNGLGLEAADQTSYLKWDAWFGRAMSDPVSRAKILQDPASALGPDVVNQIGTPSGEDLMKQVQGLSSSVAAPSAGKKVPIGDFMKGK